MIDFPGIVEARDAARLDSSVVPISTMSRRSPDGSARRRQGSRVSKRRHAGPLNALPSWKCPAIGQAHPLGPRHGLEQVLATSALSE